MFSLLFNLGIILLIATGVLALVLAGRASSPGAVRTAGILMILAALSRVMQSLVVSVPAVSQSFSDPEAFIGVTALPLELSYGLLMAGTLVALMIAVASKATRSPRPRHVPATGPHPGHAHAQPPAFGHSHHASHDHGRPHPAEHGPPAGPAAHGGGPAVYGGDPPVHGAGPAAHGGGYGHGEYSADTGPGESGGPGDGGGGDGGGGGD